MLRVLEEAISCFLRTDTQWCFDENVLDENGVDGGAGFGGGFDRDGLGGVVGSGILTASGNFERGACGSELT